jgi:hypothetical protein
MRRGLDHLSVDRQLAAFHTKDPFPERFSRTGYSVE